MSSGSEDYWTTSNRLIAGLMEVIKASVTAGGVMITALAAIKTSTDVLGTVVTTLNTVVDKLILTVAQLVGVHADTTAMIDYSSEDTGGVTTGSWQLLSSVSPKRNMLRVNNTGDQIMDYSRDAGTSTEGTIAGASSATVYDSAGFWVKETVNSTTWTAHEEWAT